MAVWARSVRCGSFWLGVVGRTGVGLVGCVVVVVVGFTSFWTNSMYQVE